MNIADWLSRLGLERYLEAFEENGVDAKVLPKLTADDLKAIGVTAVGHRRLLLDAIAQLNEHGEAGEPAAVPERRQISILFCDIVGSTRAISNLDPEEAREALGSFHSMVEDVAGRHAGFIAKFMGDGALIYFGYPHMLENNAERAATAGLALLAGARELCWPNGERIGVRIGIATGTVVVEVVGRGVAKEINVVGDTPNLAARLQSLANSGEILIDARSRRLIGDLLLLEARGERHVKGFERPVEIWAVRGEANAINRFTALRSGQLTSLVGRERALGHLLAAWQGAVGGTGRVVLLVGEAGIGKSRLMHELRNAMTGQRFELVAWYGSPDKLASAFAPVIEQLRAEVATAAGDPADQVNLRLKTVLLPVASPPDEVNAILGKLLFPDLSSPLLVNYSPQRIRRRTIEILIEQLQARAAGTPLLLLVEDYHWVDPSTRELIDILVERVPQLHLLAVVTYRPEMERPWAGRDGITTVELGRLERGEAKRMVAAVAGPRLLSPALVDRLVDRADGVPLYLEELTRSALDLAPNDGNAGTGEAVQIPDTIHGSLMARIDRIHPLREIVQVAALIGREFRVDLLAEITGIPEAELHRSLERLIDAAIILRRSNDEGPDYSFEHALIRDALAETMLRSQRRRFHGKIAETLAASPTRYGTRQPDQIGAHFAQADRPADAVPWFMGAAQEALGRFANVEAVSHLNRASAMVARLPEGPERARLELSISTLSGIALTALRGWASEEVGAAYRRAHELWQQVGQATEMFPITVGLIAYNIVRGELQIARAMAEEGLRMAEAAADDELIMAAEHELGATILYQGDTQAGLAHLRRCVALYDPEKHGRHVQVIGKNQCVAAHLHLGLALCALGEVEESIAEARRGLAVCAREPHPFSHAFARLGLIGTYVTVHDPERVLAEVDPLLAMSEEEDFPHVIAQALVMKGWAVAVTGRPEAGLAMIHQGLGMWRGIGARLRLPFYGGLLADACLAAGDVEGGLEAVEQALADRVAIGEYLLEAELFRLRGVLLQAKSGDPAAADADLLRAIESARASGCRLLELRAATSLASLWRAAGRTTEARALLEPVLATFEPDADIADVRTALGMLAALGSSQRGELT